MIGARWLRGLGHLPLWHGVLGLTYHRVGDASASTFYRGHWSASVEEFDAQLELLVKDADVITPEDVPSVVGRKGRHVLLTFDDGYRDNYLAAYPVLRARNVPATFFLATGLLDSRGPSWFDELAWMVRMSEVDRVEPGNWLPVPVNLKEDPEAAIELLAARCKPLPSSEIGSFLDEVADVTGSGRFGGETDLWLTWDMVREMRAGGMWFGGHTQSHDILSRLPAERQSREVGDCLARIGAELGERVRFFSYPEGLPTSFDDRTRRVLAENDIALAFSHYGGYMRSESFDRYDIPRMPVTAGFPVSTLRAMTALPQLFARP